MEGGRYILKQRKSKGPMLGIPVGHSGAGNNADKVVGGSEVVVARYLDSTAGVTRRPRGRHSKMALHPPLPMTWSSRTSEVSCDQHGSRKDGVGRIVFDRQTHVEH